MNYNLTVNSEGEKSLTIVDQGLVTEVTSEHPNFTRIANAVVNGEDFTGFLHVLGGFETDERVGISDDGTVTFDGSEVPESITSLIIRYAREGRNTDGLKKFLERLNDNPSFRSREQLFTWVTAKALTITPDGYFLGYKGVREDGRSCTAGTAYVDGVRHEGHIPNEVGSVITMDRKDVQDDPDHGCSYGLHVGNYSYAKDFGQRLLEVKVDPGDVVSVPKDCSFQKLRVCRYEVVALHDSNRGDDLSDWEPEPDWDDDSYSNDDEFEAWLDEQDPDFMEQFRQRVAEGSI